MILWLIDSDAYAWKQSDYNPTDDMKRKSTSVAECIWHVLFFKDKVLTPALLFQVFLAGKESRLNSQMKLFHQHRAEYFEKPPKRAEPPSYCSPVEKIKS